MQVELFDKSPAGHLVPISGTDVRTGSGFNHYAFVPNQLPPTVELASSTIKMLSEADRALGRLDARVAQLPNPGLLVRPALTREAVSTSALEGTYALLSDVLESEYVDDSHRSAEVREVRNYIRAAARGIKLIEKKPICLRVVAELQGILVKGTRGDSYDAGKLRERLVCIGDRGQGIERSRFVPPPNGDLLINGFSDWEKWVNSSLEIPVLVKAALGHYQFETLHPFSDGNGRIGRLVVILQLIEEGVLHHPVLNLSPWFEPRREDYIDHLLTVSQTGNFDLWVRFFAEAVRDRSRAADETIGRLITFSDEVVETLRREKARGAVLDLAARLIGYPVVSVTDVQEELRVSYPTANQAVGRLVELGFLREVTGGNYGRVFVCDQVREELARS